jgi:hypothetical protein
MKIRHGANSSFAAPPVGSGSDTLPKDACTAERSDAARLPRNKLYNKSLRALLRISPTGLMKNGILREDEGYDILVNGVRRTFADIKESAYQGARNLKRGICRNDIVEIRERATGVKVAMMADGRTV